MRIITIILLSILVACAGKPVVDIEIAEAIFVEPELLEDSTIFLNIRNQTDIYGIERKISKETKELLEEKGYTVSKRPSESQIYLSAVILNIKQEEQEFNLAQAFAGTVATTATGAVIGAVAGHNTSTGAGTGAGIGAGVGAGVGILGMAVAYAAQPIYWYGLVEVEIAEPHQKESTTTEKTIRDKKVSSNQVIIDNKENSAQDTMNIDEKRARETTKTTEESVVVAKSGKKKTRTKMMIRIKGDITQEEAVVLIEKALSSRLANFF